MKQHYFLLFLLLLLGSLTAQAQTVYEAENAQLQGANAGAYWGGYSGSGFAENLTQQGLSAVTFTVSVPTAGAYALEARYAAALGDTSVALLRAAMLSR